MRIAFMLCLFVALLPARAQSDLQTGIVFERFGKAKNCNMLPPLPSGLNRYILFSNSPNNSGAVIYIEGTLGPDDIMKLCYAKH